MELLNILPYPKDNNAALFIGAKGKATIVTTIFGGILQNEVTCLVCGTESKKHDPFLGTFFFFIISVLKLINLINLFISDNYDKK